MSLFSQRLKYLRRRSKLTQYELGRLLNISTSSIGMYERGSREPSLDLLLDIANFFNVSVDYLLGNDTSQLPLENEDEKKQHLKLTESEIETLLLKLEYPELFDHLLKATTNELEKISKIIKILRED